MTEEEMVEWHHQLNGYEFEQAVGVADGQGDSLPLSHQKSPYNVLGIVSNTLHVISHFLQ